METRSALASSVSIWEFAFQWIRQVDETKAVCSIVFVHVLAPLQMCLQRSQQTIRQHGDAILFAAHHAFMITEQRNR